jgi:hypothetical protein
MRKSKLPTKTIWLSCSALAISVLLPTHSRADDRRSVESFLPGYTPDNRLHFSLPKFFGDIGGAIADESGTPRAKELGRKQRYDNTIKGNKAGFTNGTGTAWYHFNDPETRKPQMQQKEIVNLTAGSVIYQPVQQGDSSPILVARTPKTPNSVTLRVVSQSGFRQATVKIDFSALPPGDGLYELKGLPKGWEMPVAGELAQEPSSLDGAIHDPLQLVPVPSGHYISALPMDDQGLRGAGETAQIPLSSDGSFHVLPGAGNPVAEAAQLSQDAR